MHDTGMSTKDVKIVKTCDSSETHFSDRCTEDVGELANTAAVLSFHPSHSGHKSSCFSTMRLHNIFPHISSVPRAKKLLVARRASRHAVGAILRL